jgi:phage shock protein A
MRHMPAGAPIRPGGQFSKPNQRVACRAAKLARNVQWQRAGNIRSSPGLNREEGIMGIFSRMTDIINSNINAMLDKAEDPEKIVRLIIQEMEDTLVEVRSAAARTIADRKTLGRKTAALESDLAEWERKAELAVEKGREDLARAALVERSRVQEALDTHQHQLEQLDESLTKLNEDIAKLQAKLADAKQRQKALTARHSSATHRLRVRSRLYDERIDDALARFEGYEQKMDHLEGRVEAYEVGREKSLDQQFAELEGDGAVDKELEALKARLRERDTETAGKDE